MDACRTSHPDGDQSPREIKVTLSPLSGTTEENKGARASRDSIDTLVPLELKVTDNGCGMSCDPEKVHLDSVFISCLIGVIIFFEHSMQR